jgi:cytidyltransferase-like protein
MKNIILTFLIFLSFSFDANANRNLDKTDNKKLNLIVYTGRFQPFHQGHYDMIKEAQKHGQHILIAISQAREMVIDERNVFSGDDREKMITDTLEKDGLKNYSIVQLDYIGKNKTLKDWDDNLIQVINNKYKEIFNTIPTKQDIAFIYYDRDKANYNKRFGNDFEIVEIKSSFDDDISATKIRKEFFEEGKIDEKLPIGTKKFLENLKDNSKIEVAITVDDLPFHGHTNSDVKKIDKVKKFISILKKYNIPEVYGFVNGGKIKNKEDEEILKLWTKEYPIGNHTFSHPSLNNIAKEEYANEILKNEEILAKFSKDNNYKFFRYTFLQEGDVIEKRNYIRNFLTNNNYQTAQVTIDFEDWAFNAAFTNCSKSSKKHKREIAALKNDYLINAEKSLKRAIKLSDHLFQKPIKHILLLHLGSMQTEMLEDLIKLYLRNNVKFISLSDAVKDEIYQIDYSTPYKEGREFIYQIAIAKNIDLKSLFKDEKFHFDPKELNIIYNLCK